MRYFYFIWLVLIFISWTVPSKTTLALENEDCFSCHNEELLGMGSEEREGMVEESTPLESEIDLEEYLKYNKPFADLSLSFNEEKYAASVHGDLECISCHEDVEDIPHQQHLKIPTSCFNCHDEEIEEAVRESAHGNLAGEKSPGCIGCHDPHYEKSGEAEMSESTINGCLLCHERRGINLFAKHGKLFSQPKLHLIHLKGNLSEIGCVYCHVPSGKKDSHRIIPAKFAVRDCVKCHSDSSILLAESESAKPSDKLLDRVTSTKFTNRQLMSEGQYVAGANRIPALDAIGLIIVFGTFGLPIVHGGLRFITRKKKGK
jgi:hypothetical protein